MTTRRTLFGAAPALLLANAAVAQPEWPSRPLRLVVPWPAGGPTDTYARALAREFAPLFPQPVVVENRTGATGTIGVQHVARAPADGHVLLVANVTALIGSVVALGEAVQFDPLRDFAPLGLFTEASSIIFAHPSLGVSDLPGLLTRARDARQLRLYFGTTGGGSVSEQSVELLARHFGLDLVKVPYRGTAPQLTDLVAGHVQIGGVDYPTASGHLREGRLRPLLVIGPRRLPELPDVPSFAEIGLTEPDFTIWNGLFAPAGVPAPVLAGLDAALVEATRSEAFRAITDGNGNRAVLLRGAEATARLSRDLTERRAFTREAVTQAKG
ncbi:Bug family tripartite tricarboxylate transporter substrate binding protein [Sabulicella rubraurantiaca]|uniref:Bug family tripartite tricarboxylate transporter substrate binding protein n=1 Tax=Sabulicella rubraurantiaca TaxID=2811429 RepID=UPI001A975C30|nr:tripartite tricarboxylate transporter substrate binding protein [Sabulicella rubraurantiaca]